MDIENLMIEILCDILDADASEITKESYLIRDLDAESIDLLELAVNINQQFSIDVIEDDLFLRQLRLFIDEANERNIDLSTYLKTKYPFLENDRIAEIIADVNLGPVLKVKDLIHYVSINT